MSTLVISVVSSYIMQYKRKIESNFTVTVRATEARQPVLFSELNIGSTKKSQTHSLGLSPLHIAHKAHKKFTTGLEIYVSQTANPRHNQQENHLSHVKT